MYFFLLLDIHHFNVPAQLTETRRSRRLSEQDAVTGGCLPFSAPDTCLRIQLVDFRRIEISRKPQLSIHTSYMIGKLPIPLYSTRYSCWAKGL